MKSVTIYRSLDYPQECQESFTMEDCCPWSYPPKHHTNTILYYSGLHILFDIQNNVPFIHGNLGQLETIMNME
jgi:hypothetical protein